jgi:pSer/pThr/pTyr-binding forkhead associated (FHA) protein
MNNKKTAYFHYGGNGGYPSVIEVKLGIGGIYTIGRYNVAAGIKQSSFEFDKATKAVSRRHAAVVRNSDGYCLVDLSSAAGTYIDGDKLIPGIPTKLENGCRVSFGHAGADYLWEE